MTVFVNGEPHDVPDASPISNLILLLDLKPERLAVEVNRRIIRRAEWDSLRLADGDKVEIVHFVGGGERSAY